MTDFEKDRLRAAKAFVQTIIVVDDEARTQPIQPTVVGELKKPRRKRRGTPVAENAPLGNGSRGHDLDAKVLVDSSLALGLLCSVVTPRKDDNNNFDNLCTSASRADIVSLDWQMNNEDDGGLALNIISKIIESDAKDGGRLRLISIYTGDRRITKIIEAIISVIPCESNPKNEDKSIVTTNGLRVVLIEKKHVGTGESGVTEQNLPAELLKEFSKLPTGMLSNVALAVVADIRKATHTSIRKFKEEMDGHYLHHQAFLEAPNKAKEYAVSLVTSEIKSQVNSLQIGSDYLSKKCVENYLTYKLKSLVKWKLKTSNEGDPCELADEQVRKFIFDGAGMIYPKKDKLDADQKKEWKNWPNDQKDVRSYFSSIFYDKYPLFERNILEFSFLSSTSYSERDDFPEDSLPKLDLGSVICTETEAGVEYFLCLQASCDTNRGKGDFFFVPLEKSKNNEGHVVSHITETDKKKLIPLKVPKSAYTRSTSICFGQIDSELGGIQATQKPDSEFYWFKDAKGIEYRWLTNLKKSRALKIAQMLSYDLARVGIDEFEPLRIKN